MPKEKKSFWAKVTGLSEEQIETETEFILPLEEINKLEEKKEETDKEKKQDNLEIKSPWPKEESEGRLAIDVYQTRDSIVIKSAIAGVGLNDLDINITNSIVTICGDRKNKEKINDQDYFYQECYWGKFSRSIILPCEIKQDKAKAYLKEGILTITLPKEEKSEVVKIEVEEKE